MNLKKRLLKSILAVACLMAIYSQCSYAIIEKYMLSTEEDDKVELNIKWDEIGEGDMGVAVREVITLMETHNVRSITLSGRILGALNFQDILTAAQQNSSLRNLLAIDVDGDMLSMLAGFIERNNTITRFGVFPTAGSGYENFESLTRALAHNRSIVSLYFNTGKLGDAEFIQLAEMLKINQVIADLDLQGRNNGNRATAEGYKAIGDALLTNRGLRTLNIGHNIGPEQGVSLIRGLLGNTRLTEMGIEYNPFSYNDADQRGNIFFRVLSMNQLIAKHELLLRRILGYPTQREIYHLLSTARFVDNNRRANPAELSLFHNVDGLIIKNIVAFAVEPYDVLYYKVVQLLRTKKIDRDFIGQTTQAEREVLKTLQRIQTDIDVYKRSLEQEFGSLTPPPRAQEEGAPPVPGSAWSAGPTWWDMLSNCQIQ